MMRRCTGSDYVFGRVCKQPMPYHSKGTPLVLGLKVVVALLWTVSALSTVWSQRLHIVAPSGSLYGALSNIDFNYVYEGYRPIRQVDNRGRVVGTWTPTGWGWISVRGALPFVWDIRNENSLVLNPRFIASNHKWGKAVRLLDGDYLAFWTSKEWDFVETDYWDPYCLALYSISQKTYDFFRESENLDSIWNTLNPIVHGTNSVYLLRNGSVWMRLSSPWYREYFLYRSFNFPGMPPRWQRNYAWHHSHPNGDYDQWSLLPSSDGTLIYGFHYYYQYGYFVRRSSGSAGDWERVSANQLSCGPVAISWDKRYALYNHFPSSTVTRCLLFDWTNRQTREIVPSSYGDYTPVSWRAEGMSEDGRLVIGTLLRVKDSRNRTYDVERAFVWERSGSSYYIDARYSECFPMGWQGRKWEAKRAIAVSPSGQFILLEVSRPIRGENNQVEYERLYALLDTDKKGTMAPTSVVCAYRNLSDRSSAYPYVGQRIELALFVEAENRHYIKLDEYDITSMSTQFGKLGWIEAGKNARRSGGEQKVINPAGNKIKLDTVLPWPYSDTSVTWYAAYPIRYREGGRHYTRYPSYRVLSRQWVWRTTELPPGTHRIFARIDPPEGVRERLIEANLYQPTPGSWLPKDRDKQEADWRLQWSQNCDEADELALRISVRQRATWISHPRRRSFVEWATSFIEVPYEWGGDWYGGRADNQPHGTNGGYGIDCSGLVCTAAQMAGYPIPRTNTSGLMHGSYTEPVSVEELEPGDLIVMRTRSDGAYEASGHVWIVYRINGRETDPQGGTRVDCILLHASGTHNKVLLTENWFYATDDEVDAVRSYRGLGLLSSTYVAKLRRLAQP